VVLNLSSVRFRVTLELTDFCDCRVKAAIPIGKKPVAEEEKKGQ
jgi:hypothetical protein